MPVEAKERAETATIPAGEGCAADRTIQQSAMSSQAGRAVSKGERRGKKKQGESAGQGDGVLSVYAGQRSVHARRGRDTSHVYVLFGCVR